MIRRWNNDVIRWRFVGGYWEIGEGEIEDRSVVTN